MVLQVPSRGKRAASRHNGLFAEDGRRPLLCQYLLGFFGHPEVYVMIPPTFGVMSQIVAAFSRTPVFGYLGMVYAMPVIGPLGFLVWARHIYTSSLGLATMANCSSATMVIAVPTRVKVFSWIAWFDRAGNAAAVGVGLIFVCFTVGGKPGECEFRYLGV
jgi:cytochrome c oxidase subunit 1